VTGTEVLDQELSFLLLRIKNVHLTTSGKMLWLS